MSKGILRFRRSPLLRPLAWSAGLHLAVLILFSVRAAGELRGRPLSFMVNWAGVSGTEVSLLLAPADRPAPVIAPGATGAERTGSRMEPRRLAAARLRDLPVPVQREGLLERPEPGGGIGPGPDFRRIRAGKGAFADPGDLAGTVGPLLPQRREIPGETVEEPGIVPVPEWRNLAPEETAGVKAAELGVRGGEPLLSREVVAYRIPRWESAGLPVVYRFRVAADGRVTSVIPISAGSAERVSETCAALLGWRFEPVPGREDVDGMWGTIEFK